MTNTNHKNRRAELDAAAADAEMIFDSLNLERAVGGHSQGDLGSKLGITRSGVGVMFSRSGGKTFRAVCHLARILGMRITVVPLDGDKEGTSS